MVGSYVLHLLPKNLWAGLVSIPSVGVLRQSSKARCSDWPESLHFENCLLTVLTLFSTFPFDWGYLGEDVECLKPQSFANLVNSVEENWGPLSDTSLSGIP